MNAAEALRRLRSLRTPVFTTADAAIVLSLRVDAASHTLRRLAAAQLATAVRRGLWSTGAALDPYVLLEHVTAPHPSYVSLQSALHQRGMLEQIPAVVYAVTLGRSGRIRTAVATYSLHHIPVELFGGFEYQPESGVKLAYAEKALVDMLYLSGTRLRLFRVLPEIELPPGFRPRFAKQWIARIPTPRLRTLVERRLQEVLEQAG